MELTHRVVECRTKRTFKISQSADDRFRMVVCELRHGDAVGYGESSPSKRVTGETLESVGTFLDWAAKEIADVPVGRWESFLDHVHDDIGGSRSARAALDLAVHDLVAKVQEMPVRALYDLPRARLETCMTVSVDEPDVMAQEARGYRDDGFRVLKLKLGKGERDVARVAAVRAACPDARLRADANTGWTPAEARRVTAALAKAGVEFVEQPFLPADDAELAALSKESPLTLYADESVKDVEDVRRLHALGFVGG
ncbi:MAG TPA: enolase C-terminal domain-like protein, partial [Candidatus Thermoplasmatota archaeon]|nr:enolase C-terminal domain-like protein [Candidatus Thermoplasmatota archaeon]